MFALLRSQGILRYSNRPFKPSSAHSLTSFSQRSFHTALSVSSKRIQASKRLSINQQRASFLTDLKARRLRPLDYFSQCLDLGDASAIENMLSLIDPETIKGEYKDISLLKHVLKIQFSQKEKIADLLLTHEAQVDRDAFFLACIYNLPPLVKRMIGEYNFPINSQDPNGDTALHKATSYGCREVVDCLINCKADLNIKNKAGFKPIDNISHLPFYRLEMLNCFLSSPRIDSYELTRILRKYMDERDHSLSEELIKKVDHSHKFDGITNLYYTLSKGTLDSFLLILEKTQNALPDSNEEHVILYKAVQSNYLRNYFISRLEEKCPAIKPIVQNAKNQYQIAMLEVEIQSLTHKVTIMHEELMDLKTPILHKTVQKIKKAISRENIFTGSTGSL